MLRPWSAVSLGARADESAIESTIARSEARSTAESDVVESTIRELSNIRIVDLATFESELSKYRQLPAAVKSTLA